MSSKTKFVCLIGGVTLLLSLTIASAQSGRTPLRPTAKQPAIKKPVKSEPRTSIPGVTLKPGQAAYVPLKGRTYNYEKMARVSVIDSKRRGTSLINANLVKHRSGVRLRLQVSSRVEPGSVFMLMGADTTGRQLMRMTIRIAEAAKPPAANPPVSKGKPRRIPTPYGPTRIVVLRKIGETEKNRAKSLPKLSKSQFTNLVNAKDRKVLVMNDHTVAASIANVRKARTQVQQKVSELYRMRPDLIRSLPKTTRSRPASRVPTTTVTDRNGKKQTYLLQGRASLEAEMALKARTMATRSYQLKMLAQVHAMNSRVNNAMKAQMKRSPKLAARQSQLQSKLTLLHPSRMSRAELSRLKSATSDLISVYLGNTRGGGQSGGRGGPDEVAKGLPAPPARKPKACSEELGAGNGGDMTNPMGRFSSNGLYFRTHWPLKYYNTCVREQANRGTCSAFGVIAAVESAVARKYGVWMNLSEQDLYKSQRLDWFPVNIDGYGDGFNTAYSMLSQGAGGHVFPFERDWNYNPSLSRVDDEANRRYTNSCDDYSGPCSDTNHQAAKKCHTVEETVVEEVVTTVSTWVADFAGLLGGELGHWVEETVTETVEKVVTYEVCVYETNIPGTSGVKVTGFLPIFVPGVTPESDAVRAAKAFLSDSKPIVYTFLVVPSFGGATSNNGFVRFDPDETDGPGTHAMLLTGFVDNEDLPFGVVSGRGGGYFIAKNSWGADFGDNGYCYIPYDWFKKWTRGMDVVTDVTRN